MKTLFEMVIEKKALMFFICKRFFLPQIIEELETTNKNKVQKIDSRMHFEFVCVTAMCGVHN